MNLNRTSILFLMAVVMPAILKAQSNSFVGKVIEPSNHNGVPYVSVGIKGKPFGTIADSTGQFKLFFDPSAIDKSDTIIFTHVGYDAVKKSPAELMAFGNLIAMQQRSTILNEVKISPQKEKIEVYGRTPTTITYAPNAYSSIPKISDVSGREQATILDVDKDILLKQINFMLWSNNYKRLKCRVNFYSVKDDMPDKLISPEDIIYETQNTHGYKKIDLNKYNIHLKGYKKIAVSIQLIEADLSPNDVATTSFLIPAYPLTFRKSYFREKSESNWVPVKSSYLYINIEAYRVKE
ncbi:MAG TPA: carboxypeptidase-like regulatory domain-containing protein [Mucilaginibacter sp.]|nr:carboxypeptidase-like regulatory domain-containing protein [Mucilaginibacter sp.]